MSTTARDLGAWRDGYVERIEAERAATQAALRGPTSSLAAVARHELPIGAALTIGPDSGADLALAGMDRAVRIEALPDGFRIDGALSDPRSIEVGRYTLRLSHQNYPAVVVLDRESPHLREDVERRWYPVDPRFRIVARFVPDRGTTAIASTASGDRPAERAGWLQFSVGGVACRLAALRLLEPGFAPDHLDAYFRDATTGRGSYEVGRYVTVERHGDAAIVDFNLAYNPACALSPYYNCPIPPPENHLPVAIRAGEMTPHRPSGQGAAH